MMIKRSKTAAATTTDLGYGAHGRRMNVSTTPAEFEIVHEVKTVHKRDRIGRPTRVKTTRRIIGTMTGKRYTHRMRAADGRCYTCYGTWADVKRKIEANPYSYPLVHLAER